MKVLISVVLFLLTACYYRKVQVNARDRAFIPYLQTNYLVFVNSGMVTDTILLENKLWRSSNLDFSSIGSFIKPPTPNYPITKPNHPRYL